MGNWNTGAPRPGMCSHWPDFRLAKDLYMEGVNLLGWADDTGLWRLRPESELAKIASTMTPPKQFYDNNSKRHRRVIRRLRERFGQKREDPAFMAECRAAWDASITEVHAGTCQGPFTVSSIEKRYGYGRLRVIGRHVVHQGEKIRAVDDARANGTNAMLPLPAPKPLVLWRPTVQSLLLRSSSTGRSRTLGVRLHRRRLR